MMKIIFLILMPFILFAQGENLLLLMGDEGIGEYPVTADLVHSYDEREMTAASWADQTGSLDFEQATEGNQPTLNTSAINGYPALTFDGVDNFMATGSLTLSQPFTFYFVLKQITWTDSDRLINANGEISISQGGDAGQSYMYAGSYDPRKSLPANTYCVIACVYNNASSVFNLNGSDTTNTAGTYGITAGIHLCSYLDGAQQFGNYEIAAIYIHSAAHDEATRTTIITWLNTKYSVY